MILTLFLTEKHTLRNAYLQIIQSFLPQSLQEVCRLSTYSENIQRTGEKANSSAVCSPPPLRIQEFKETPLVSYWVVRPGLGSFGDAIIDAPRLSD
jgi:hypothetical protein